MAIIEQTEGRLVQLGEAGNTRGGVQTLSEVLRKVAESAQLAFNHDGGVTSVATGHRSLDRQLVGLQPSDLIILAARAWARLCVPPGHTRATSPTNIGANAARCHGQTQARGLFHV
jgi:replicative DNA helicase